MLLSVIHQITADLARAKTIDDYIATFPKNVQVILEELGR